MRKSAETLDTEKLQEYIESHTHYVVESFDRQEERVIVHVRVSTGPDVDEYEKKHGLLDFNKGKFEGQYTELDEQFFSE